jgi:hypothetical protein
MFFGPKKKLRLGELLFYRIYPVATRKIALACPLGYNIAIVHALLFFNTNDRHFTPTHIKAQGELGRLNKFHQGFLGELVGFYSSEKNILVCVTVKL